MSKVGELRRRRSSRRGRGRGKLIRGT